MQFPAPKRLPLGPLMDFGYEDEVLFPLKLARGKALSQARRPSCKSRLAGLPRGLHSGQSGTGTERERLPVVEIATIKTVSLASDCDFFKRLAGRLPKPLPANFKAVFQPTKEGFRLSVETGQRETEASLLAWLFSAGCC
jgi:hypothetical protein